MSSAEGPGDFRFLAQNGHAGSLSNVRFPGIADMVRTRDAMSAYDPKRTFCAAGRLFRTTGAIREAVASARLSSLEFQGEGLRGRPRATEI